MWFFDELTTKMIKPPAYSDKSRKGRALEMTKANPFVFVKYTTAAHLSNVCFYGIQSLQLKGSVDQLLESDLAMNSFLTQPPQTSVTVFWTLRHLTGERKLWQSVSKTRGVRVRHIVDMYHKRRVPTDWRSGELSEPVWDRSVVLFNRASQLAVDDEAAMNITEHEKGYVYLAPPSAFTLVQVDGLSSESEPESESELESGSELDGEDEVETGI